MRKTKIIVTIGPTSRDPETLDRLMAAGIDCARLNFAHGTLEEHGEVIRILRQLSEKYQRPVAILQDLGGVKLRLGQLEGTVRVIPGQEVWVVPEASSRQPDVLPFPRPDILQNLERGNLVYIADGVICLEVLETQGSRVRARVRNGGMLSSFKGVNLPGVKIDQPVLTEEDRTALRFGVAQDVDWVAVSFVRTGEDIRDARSYLDDIGSKALVMAKLERAEGIDNIDSILEGVNGVMVARGDLGVEIPMAKVPIVQKQIVKKANEGSKVSVIATQMLRSMMVSPTPTRAEVSDVTTAVLDGCDAIMLSDETAVGQYPVETVEVANASIHEAEGIYPYHRDLASRNRTQAIAAGADRLVRDLNSKPIVITSTGRAALEVSRYRPNNNILVFAHDEAVLRKMCLGWGLVPAGVIPPERDVPKLVAMIVKAALATGLVTETDVLTIVHGLLVGVSGTTNTIQVLDMQEYLSYASPVVETSARR